MEANPSATRDGRPGPDVIAYLASQYPKTSHTFIRREIAALERLGFEVRRYATRPVDEKLVDPEDLAEKERTSVVLARGASGLLLASLAVLLRAPGRWFGALSSAVGMGWRSERGVLTHLAYHAEACVLVRWMRAQSVRHLHAHFATNATTIALLARELGGPPFSFTIHGPHDLTSAPLLALDRKTRGAKFVAAVSHHTRAQLLRYAGPEDWSKIRIVRCGIDGLYLKQPLAPPAPAPRFLCIARFDPEKGHLVLLEAAARLAAEGLEFRIELVGDGRLRPEIESAVERLGLRRHVALAGWKSSPDVRDLLLASRALVLPSFAEGLPVVLMEALALGRPVVATYVAGIPELVVEGENGWLVPASSVEDLARALRAALLAPDETIARMGARGRERVLVQHDVDREAGRLADLFRAPPGRLPDETEPAATVLSSLPRGGGSSSTSPAARRDTTPA
jgi:glycosyltransferase involved in cell wall biosynthesis